MSIQSIVNPPAMIAKLNLREFWEEAITKGITLRETKDNAQWLLGELADLVASNYGTASLKDFSRDIGMAYNTLREYRRVFLRIPEPERIVHLSFRHHQKASDTLHPKEWLEKASDNSWSSERLELEISRSKHITIPEEHPRVDVCDKCHGWLVFSDKVKPCSCGSRYKFTIDNDN